jgi:predicted PurR-regulated permease PerM
MIMNTKEITFDRFAKLLINTAIIVGIFMIIRYLSGVLIPFFIGFMIAYLLFPFVKFIQTKLKVRNRVLSMILVFALVAGLVAGLLWLIVPLIQNEVSKTIPVIVNYIDNNLNNNNIIGNFIAVNARKLIADFDYQQLISFESIDTILEKVLPKFLSFFSATWHFILGFLVIFFVILYVVFILLDYEKLNSGIINLFKPRHRTLVKEIHNDLSTAMNQYFRGQALISLITGILYCIGFSVIGLPMAVAMGIFIGILHFVPYLQTIGFVPVIFLASLNSLETGSNFWLMLLGIFVVFAIIQCTLDLFLTPKIMGKNMGMKPAVILLSISIWGVLLGFIGLILALPLTTVAISYYKRFVIKE